jgi:hypothetical protein
VLWDVFYEIARKRTRINLYGLTQTRWSLTGRIGVGAGIKVRGEMREASMEALGGHLGGILSSHRKKEYDIGQLLSSSVQPAMTNYHKMVV